MKGSLQNKLKFNSIALLIIIILSLGIFFRVSGINSKVYWHDEVATSIKVAGYTFQEIDTLPFEQGTILVSDLDKYQYPNNQKNYLDSINALSIEEPQLTPLYFLLLRLWIRIFGQSIVTIRSLSVIISLLIIPVFYWLCFELFDSVTIGWMGILLVSVSPIHIIYAHEARPYIMWGLTTMLSCIAFLKAIKYSNKLSWAIYSLSIAVGFYTYLFSFLVYVGQGIYIFTVEKYRLNKNIICFLVSSLTGFLLFLPWAFAIYDNYSSALKATGWLRTNGYFPSLVRTWMLNLSRIFFDNNSTFEYSSILIYLGIIFLIIYGTFLLVTNTNKTTWLFVLTVLCMPAFILVFTDIILGGRSTGTLRYFVPSWLGIEIILAYLLVKKSFNLSLPSWQLFCWKAITILVLSSGIISGVFIERANTWWNKGGDYYTHQAAIMINKSEHPLVIVNSTKKIFTISKLVKKNTEFYTMNAFKQGKLKFTDKKYTDVFLFAVKNSPSIEYIISKNTDYKVKQVWEWKRSITPVQTVHSTLHQIVPKSIKR